MSQTPEQAFPDKKEVLFSYKEITDHIQRGIEIRDGMDVGQETGTWLIHQTYPPLPVAVTWMTDIHYGNLGTDYDRLNKHLQIIADTPNFYCIIGGDAIDNFAIKHAHAGIMGDEIPPQMQAQAFMQKLLELDRQSKIGALVYGNHEDWMNIAGYDFYQTFMGDFRAPIFDKGGVLTVLVESQKYSIGLGHKHWGVSKLNITNAAKRGMEFSWPGTDIVLVGDDHQGSAELFSRGGERKLVIDGGTYNLNGPTGKKWGLGPAGEPGYTIMLWPNARNMEVVDNPEIAQQMLLQGIYSWEVAHGQKEEAVHEQQPDQNPRYPAPV